ncbi:MAG: hypothetical protein ACU0DT_07205 [Albimonas sp.]|tara:strand:+ start:3269 stop:3412 length:144 start_codon:yes stop_codon:yes gene_type:complete
MNTELFEQTGIPSPGHAMTPLQASLPDAGENEEDEEHPPLNAPRLPG